MKEDKRSKTDRIMDFADELGSLTTKRENKKAWNHLLVYAPTDKLIEELSKRMRTIHNAFENTYEFYYKELKH